MSSDLLVIVDDNSNAFSYSSRSTNWNSTTLAGWYKDSTVYAFNYASFKFTFNGTSAAFIGATPPTAYSLVATVSIDEGTPFRITYRDLDPPTYKPWFITPTLADGVHSIVFSEMYGTRLDYAIVTVGTNTPLTGETIIVDDDSSLIRYSGQWSRNTDQFIPGYRLVPKGYPYGNVSHRSSNPGDKFMFRFSGISVAVYGIFSSQRLGSMTVSYSIDGTPHYSSVHVNTSSTGYLDGYGEIPNYLFFSQAGLLSGTHTLLVKIIENNNQVFMLDYITYTPAFDSLSSMPTLSTDFDTSSGTTSIAQQVSTGVLIGGVFGALAFGVLVTIFVVSFIRRRRRTRAQDAYHGSMHDAALGSGVNEPSLNPYTSTYFQAQGHPSNAVGIQYSLPPPNVIPK